MFYRIARGIILGLAVPFLISGAISSYRAWVQVRRLDLYVGPTLRAGSPARADVVSSGRVPVTLRIELVQGTESESLAVKVIPSSPEPFFDPRSVKGTISVTVTPQMLARFAARPAVVRVTARGRPQWMREPPPVVRQVPVVIER